MTLRTLFEKSSDADLPRETTGAAAGALSWRRGLAALFVGLAVLSATGTKATAQDTPNPISATLLRFVVAHDGATAFYLELDFSREPAGLSPDSIDGGVVGVEGGDITFVSRNSDRRWGLLVTPATTGNVTVTVRATTDCAAPHAVCAADGGMLARGTQATIPGPVWFSVADATATEAPGATLDFTVTLSRAFYRTVTVDYATVDGTATAGADYTSTSGTLTFGWNETAKTVSVPVLDDAHDDGGETLTLALSNPSPSRARLADATATGTVADTDVTATLSSAVVEHDGAAPFDLHLDVSREPAGLSYRSIDGGVVNVQGGDVTRVWRRQAGSSRRWGVRVASGDFSKYQPLQGDFDGDGVTDLAWALENRYGLYARVALSNGDGTFSESVHSRPRIDDYKHGYVASVGDFNGDGLSDIVWTLETRYGLNVRVALSNGDGRFSGNLYSSPRTGDFSDYKPLPSLPTSLRHQQPLEFL